MDKVAALELTKNLSANEEHVRMKTFEKVKQLLKAGQINSEYFGYIWQGIYFCLWHSDTMIKQTKISNDIAAMECHEEHFFEWFKFGFIVLRKHWNELDFYRINKFMYLVRVILVACFKKIESNGFKKQVFSAFNDAITQTVLNEEVLERGFILHIVQIYPSIALEIDYKSPIELFFCFKPIFNLLSFTNIRLLRENITEKLLDDFVPFCGVRLTEAAISFVKEKLFSYATHESIPQPNRNKVYQLIEALTKLEEEAAEDRIYGEKSPETSGEKSRPKIDVKASKTSSGITKTIKKVTSQKTANGSSSLHRSKDVPAAFKPKEHDEQTHPSRKSVAEGVNVGLMSPVAVIGAHSTTDISKNAKADKAKTNQKVIEEKKLSKKERRLLRQQALQAQVIEQEIEQEVDEEEEAMPGYGEEDQPIKTGLKKAKANTASSSRKQKKMDIEHDSDEMSFENFLEKAGSVNDLYASMGITAEDVQTDDEETVSLETMDYDELRKKLPPYFFMTPKKKVKYFKKITSDYLTKLRKQEDDPEKTQRVNFQLDRSKIKVFDKFLKVSGKPMSHKNGSKKILKSRTD